jgi:aconitate decarboxylase
MAGTHPTVDCIRNLQKSHPDRMRDFTNIKSIKIVLGEVAYHHGGFTVSRPVSSTGAQMSNAFVAATQMVHCEVLPAQFRHDMLENDVVWALAGKTVCEQSSGDRPVGEQQVTIEFADGEVLTEMVNGARGVNPPLSNSEVQDKFRQLTAQVVDKDRAEKIERAVLTFETVDDVSSLGQLLLATTKNPIA